jgi:hypothetical protein
MIQQKPLKQKKCKSKQCGKLFMPTMPLQSVCDWSCAIAYNEASKQKKNSSEERKSRKETKQKLEKFKTITEWANEAQDWVNKYARLRDRFDGCISCDKPPNWHGQWHGSHFRSRKAASAVRFNLWNIHKGCSVCNKWLSGNLSEYEPRLIAKIGQEKVDWLRSQNQTVSYSIEYLKRLKAVFKKKCARLEKRISNGN